MDNSKKEKEIPTTRPSAAAAPKRVSGGLVLKAKKKKRRRIQHDNSTTTTAAYSSLPTHGQRDPPSSSSGVPSILSSIPTNNEEEQRSKQSIPDHDEFGDDAFDDDVDVPSDALICLQSYTRSSSGGMSETCAYCPIFTHEGGDSSSNNGGSSSSSTHAAPFLAKHIMIHLLNAQSSNHTSNNASPSIAHIEQEIKQLASSNKVRLLQLNGTATTRSTIGWRGDGNDDEDIAIMEISSYAAAAEMALQNYFQVESATLQHKYKVNMVHSWLTMVLLPYFAVKTWFSSGALDSFYDNAMATSEQKYAAIKNGHSSDYATKNHHTIPQMKEMMKQLVSAGVLLPRRGIGPSGGEGYWFSLPGLGKAAKSIVDGRTNLIRRLQFSRYKEKKRSVLEHEIGRIKQGPVKKKKMEQSGKIVVLDLLAKGWVSIHTTCTGDQFVRLME